MLCLYFFDFSSHFQILYGVPKTPEVSKNLPGARSSVLTEYEPISCHGDTIRSQYYNFLRCAHLRCATLTGAHLRRAHLRISDVHI